MSLGDHTVAQAARLRKPSWRDPRLLIGILLVLASVAAVVTLVRASDRTIEVYAAKDDIAVGQAISEDDLVIVNARLGDADGAYHHPAAGLPQNAVATRLLTRGELLPRSAVGFQDALDRKPVGLPVDIGLPEGVGKGSFVDVWVSARDGRDGFTQPQLLLNAAEIAEIGTSSTAFGARSSTLIHVLVDDVAMPRLLAALANESRIAVVPNPSAAPAGSTQARS